MEKSSVELRGLFRIRQVWTILVVELPEDMDRHPQQWHSQHGSNCFGSACVCRKMANQPFTQHLEKPYPGMFQPGATMCYLETSESGTCRMERVYKGVMKSSSGALTAQWIRSARWGVRADDELTSFHGRPACYWMRLACAQEHRTKPRTRAPRIGDRSIGASRCHTSILLEPE